MGVLKVQVNHRRPNVRYYSRRCLVADTTRIEKTKKRK